MISLARTTALSVRRGYQYGRPAFVAGSPSLRRIHSALHKATTSSARLHTNVTTQPESSNFPTPYSESQAPTPKMRPQQMSPLSRLPLSILLRNLVTNTVTASPALLSPSLALLSRLVYSKNSLLNPDKNPILRLGLKKSLYAQFCAGENNAEVQRTVRELKGMGFSGVILAYAKEVVMRPGETNSRQEPTEVQVRIDVATWRQSNLDTVGLAQHGDFVALKFTGAGQETYSRLAARSPTPHPDLAAAIEEICALAVSRGVHLLIDAEQLVVQPGIDAWAIEYMSRYNNNNNNNINNINTPARATVYLTYQAYLKRVPDILRQHLEAARRGGYTLGIKMVRGAYLATDPRTEIHDTKENTDEAYNSLVQALLTRRWNTTLPGTGPFPDISLILASHNSASVERARHIVSAGQARTEVAFAQLQGMADEVSCSLLAARPGEARQLKAYKYLVWGSTGDCMKYLLRRAEENRDAVQRTREGRDAMWRELLRRIRRTIGISG